MDWGGKECISWSKKGKIKLSVNVAETCAEEIFWELPVDYSVKADGFYSAAWRRCVIQVD